MDVHTRRGLGAVRTLQQVGDATGELHALEPTGDLAPGVVEHLAVLGGEEGGDVVGVSGDQLAEAEHRPGPAAERGRAPVGGGDGRTFTAASTSAVEARATSAACTPRAGS